MTEQATIVSDRVKSLLPPAKIAKLIGRGRSTVFKMFNDGMPYKLVCGVRCATLEMVWDFIEAETERDRKERGLESPKVQSKDDFAERAKQDQQRLAAIVGTKKSKTGK